MLLIGGENGVEIRSSLPHKAWAMKTQADAVTTTIIIKHRLKPRRLTNRSSRRAIETLAGRGSKTANVSQRKRSPALADTSKAIESAVIRTVVAISSNHPLYQIALAPTDSICSRALMQIILKTFD